MLNIRNVARAVREVWLKGTDAEGCIPGGSAKILAKLLAWKLLIIDYDLRDALEKLAEMGCFSLEQQPGEEQIRRHGNYSICDIDVQALTRLEMFGEM